MIHFGRAFPWRGILFRMVAWVAIAISVISACIATVAAWTNREKLRLDLYDRRFRIYESALTLKALLWPWLPSDDEIAHGDLQESPELKEALSDFDKKSVEGQFLFSQDSGVPFVLRRICFFAHAMVDSSLIGGARTGYGTNSRYYKECMDELPEKIAPFLNFHSYSALPRFPFDEKTGNEWP